MLNDENNCCLTIACMKHYREKFDDNCYELRVLRWFKDNYLSIEDVLKYNEISPIIVDKINNKDDIELIYNFIFNDVILYLVKAIEESCYKEAYKKYKCIISVFEKEFVNKLHK